MGYDANPVARSLRTGHTYVFGIFFRPVDAIPGSLGGTEYHIRLAGGAAAQALSLGYGLLHTPNPVAPGAYAYPMDGCVIVGPEGNDGVLTALLARGIPVVCVEPDPDRPLLAPFVDRDDAAAMQRVLAHLKEEGAKSYGFLCVADDISWTRSTMAAFDGWLKSKDTVGDLYRLSGDLGSEGARQICSQLIAEGRLPDAIVCSTSRFAVGVAQAAKDAGLQIPEDLMVTALSDSELARSYRPQITALDLHGDKIGQAAIAMLADVVQGNVPTISPLVPPTLRLRASSNRKRAISQT
ncbi:LacI family DNA-binding transcriptional regulator [Paraburkholderia sp. 22B1P]|uniref:LacI family DNA-binding transcriptional regulator n=1 Tax=Paraburkholderia sp. 22B1P TaxID=3080498 RepID=UPI0030922485|nr:LacI family DNA-binding transcriptional regulator [Paraburkholderia sp. 22B1P]